MKNPKTERSRNTDGGVTLTLLRSKYLMAWSEYLELAKEGSALLAQLTDVPIPESKQNEILSQRGRELAAHATYSKARKRLWDFLTHSKPDRSDGDLMGTSKDEE
jgi:hypothetical protein